MLLSTTYSYWTSINAPASSCLQESNLPLNSGTMLKNHNQHVSSPQNGRVERTRQLGSSADFRIKARKYKQLVSFPPFPIAFPRNLLCATLTSQWRFLYFQSLPNMYPERRKRIDRTQQSGLKTERTRGWRKSCSGSHYLAQRLGHSASPCSPPPWCSGRRDGCS